MKVNIVGNMFGSDGYSMHVRRLANALVTEGVEVAVHTDLPQGFELLCNDAELKMIKNQWFNDGHTVCITTPQHWPKYLNLPCKSFNGFCVWEGDKVPRGWEWSIRQVTDMSESGVSGRKNKIFVPSNHVKEALINTWPEWTYMHGVTKIVPHGVDTKLFKPQKHSKKDPFTFVVNKGWNKGMRDRGGVQYVLKAFSEEFKPKEKVRLRVKLNPSYISSGFDPLQEMTKIGITNHANIEFNTTDLTYKELPTVYEGDVFVSATMGEAFNIPCLEAMSCGLPVIATCFGGQTDYFEGWLVPYTLVENTWEVAYEGVQWAEINMMVLKRSMREAFENKELMFQMRNESIATANNWTWKHSAKKLIKVLENDNI